uniref:Uncharacterized protein n=1 Tax=Ditylum brightwellii TaxID=49249 RepID=A0A6V2QSI3_9STRA|mmetsp:Transcript_9997/g.14847  ORF Transcript_9997/g.14847 Transcript_9997/m.14847 type:complete len:336 (-) Transcript_9997:177-1184(-)
MKCLSKMFGVFRSKNRQNDSLNKEAQGVDDEFDELGGMSICDNSAFSSVNYAISPSAPYANQWLQQQVKEINRQQKHNRHSNNNNITILSNDDDDIFDMLAKTNNEHDDSSLPASEVQAARDDGSISSLDTTNDFYTELLMKRTKNSLGPDRDESQEAEDSLFSSSSCDVASMLASTHGSVAIAAHAAATVPSAPAAKSINTPRDEDYESVDSRQDEFTLGESVEMGEELTFHTENSSLGLERAVVNTSGEQRCLDSPQREELAENPISRGQTAERGNSSRENIFKIGVSTVSTDGNDDKYHPNGLCQVPTVSSSDTDDDMIERGSNDQFQLGTC